MKTRRTMIAKVAGRYQSATKKQKGAMLTRLSNMLGYTRNSLSWILTRHGKKAASGKRRIESRTGGSGRGRPRVYDESFIVALKTLWVEMGRPCGQRMATNRKEALEHFERAGKMTVDQPTTEKLLKVSPAMIDILLAPEKKKRAKKQKRKANRSRDS